jgi:hypothetical protein
VAEAIVDKHVILARLRSLLDNMPVVAQQGAQPKELVEWLGRARVIVQQHDGSEGASVRHRINSLLGTGLPSTRAEEWSHITLSLVSAITEIELQLPEDTSEHFQAFAAGTPYDLFKEVTKALLSATQNLMIIDPYMDADIFDRYLSVVPRNLPCKLLANRYSNNVKSAAQAFSAQHQINLEIRKSDKTHDRLIFANDICWILGQSIKDAAVSKPTYFGSLSPDVSKLKYSYYEDIWNNATVVFP